MSEQRQNYGHETPRFTRPPIWAPLSGNKPQRNKGVRGADELKGATFQGPGHAGTRRMLRADGGVL